MLMLSGLEWTPAWCYQWLFVFIVVGWGTQPGCSHPDMGSIIRKGVGLFSWSGTGLWQCWSHHSHPFLRTDPLPREQPTPAARCATSVPNTGISDAVTWPISALYAISDTAAWVLLALQDCAPQKMPHTPLWLMVTFHSFLLPLEHPGDPAHPLQHWVTSLSCSYQCVFSILFCHVWSFSVSCSVSLTSNQVLLEHWIIEKMYL